MKLVHPRLLLGAASLGAVLFIAWVELDRTSPGPLSRTHAQLPALDAPDGCDDCHGSLGESMAQACGECHPDVIEDVAEGGGLHGQVDAAFANACARCHPEHRGPDFSPAGPRSFALAGIDEPDRYDHQGLDFTLEGRHLELECAACHPLANAELTVEGQHRFQGLSKACSSCHEDVHQGQITRECAACHGQAQPFPEVVAFAHQESIALGGAHAQASCRECHARDTEHSVERLSGSDTPPPSRTCSACHTSPHDARFLGEVAARTDRIIGGDDCAPCHADDHLSFPGPEVAMPRELHAASVFPLDPPHDVAACEDCHPMPEGQPAERFAARFPGRDPLQCAACHADPHAGQFADGPFGEEGCLGCHAPLAFVPSAFGGEHHARTSFPLQDSHRAVGCDRCHVPSLDPSPEARRFADAPTACAACHEDAHRGTLVGLEHADSACEECHTPTVFSDVVPTRFAHGTHTSFPLLGAHAAAACEACHPAAEEVGIEGRTFGFAADVFGTPVTACATCHSDPHGPRFADRSGALAASDCAPCHTPDTFRATTPETFEHGRWTGFPLDGAHAEAECAACHAASPTPDEHGRTFGRAEAQFGTPVTSCATCHTNVHGDVFNRGSISLSSKVRDGCARCHDTTSFGAARRVDFDHAPWTGFPLDGAHAKVECAGCHAPLEVPAPNGRTTRPAAGTDCAACHEDPHVGQFVRDGRTACDRCHPVDGTLEFDHAADSRFPLDERHASLACAACHVPWPLADGRKVVRYRPLGLTCVDCHGIDFGKEGGTR